MRVKQVSHGGKKARAIERRRDKGKRRSKGAKLLVSNTTGIINQISHNPLRRDPSLGLVQTCSAGHGASIGVAMPMLTVLGEEGEGVRRGVVFV